MVFTSYISISLSIATTTLKCTRAHTKQITLVVDFDDDSWHPMSRFVQAYTQNVIPKYEQFFLYFFALFFHIVGSTFNLFHVLCCYRKHILFLLFLQWINLVVIAFLPILISHFILFNSSAIYLYVLCMCVCAHGYKMKSLHIVLSIFCNNPIEFLYMYSKAEPFVLSFLCIRLSFNVGYGLL